MERQQQTNQSYVTLNHWKNTRQSWLLDFEGVLLAPAFIGNQGDPCWQWPARSTEHLLAATVPPAGVASFALYCSAINTVLCLSHRVVEILIIYIHRSQLV